MTIAAVLTCRRAAQIGGGNLVAPVQRVTDFLAGTPSTTATLPSSSYRSGTLSIDSMLLHHIQPGNYALLHAALCCTYHISKPDHHLPQSRVALAIWHLAGAASPSTATVPKVSNEANAKGNTVL